MKRLGKLSDYHSEEYMEIKNKLDQMILTSYDHEAYYYYAIYTTDGKTINCLMDYEDTTVCGQPIYEFGDNEYTQVLVTGETYTVSEISSYGSWMFTLLPVRDDCGSIIAFIEVGSSLDKAVQEKRDLVVENIITVICSCGVMIMLVLECIFVLSFFEKRKGIPKEQWDITQQMPIRLMVFLSYMTDSMQDAFNEILRSRQNVRRQAGGEIWRAQDHAAGAFGADDRFHHLPVRSRLYGNSDRKTIDRYGNGTCVCDFQHDGVYGWQ